MPLKSQGVVDAKLKVYGTTNLRIADLSVVPLNIAAHPQGKYIHAAATPDYLLTLIVTATAYVIGEKGMYMLCHQCSKNHAHLIMFYSR